ncbi:hypothetical protein ASPZODRAFT_151778 [Penicilliopsis zonata CBS 506.65]|uniref:CBM21 domain-containing protein n=1 Tax=Penicilliopsis zonata CBS 506.65 TaxID=1073090 RepID=A0A1L9SJH6_9EURO|nr:hypothetical protein ASPZODRAFT_151778 [Penicilliopsis zonata CBS 506.65]OJJ47261.1 hypothetical protein ASPZODRAFT_151778 [Penicilliopsis zonata CBS 506.65]
MPYTAPSLTAQLETQSSSHHHQHHDHNNNNNNNNNNSHKNTSPDYNPSVGRQQHLPRSYYSTAYVRKHRRSPSAPKPPPAKEDQAIARRGRDLDPYASLRQSPPPRSNAAIPPGTVISPPESCNGSSDEESPSSAGAGVGAEDDDRRNGIKLAELQAAVRSIEQRHESSPERAPSGDDASSSGFLPPTSPPPPPPPLQELQSRHTTFSSPHTPPLSKEARKISHSRSSTEGSIMKSADEIAVSSPEETDRDDEPKPAMVRKKSGELVRPALRPPSARRRPSSMPGTPTYAKAVHFDSHLEHIRHFMQLDKPLAVSAETSPVEDYAPECEFPFEKDEPQFEWDLRLANWPHDLAARAHQPVRLERLFLSSDKNTLVGVIAVANLSFHKHVVSRFTFDFWKTVSEVTAEFSHDVRRKQAHDGYDRFSFNIKLADQTNLEEKTLFLCIRYQVDGQEFWDNNNSMNYQVDFCRVPKVKPNMAVAPLPTSSSSLGLRKNHHGNRPLPRSKTSLGIVTLPRESKKKAEPSFDGFSPLDSLDDCLTFGRPSNRTSKRPPIPLAQRHVVPVDYQNNNDDHDDVDADDDDDHHVPKPRENPSRPAFGNRYDFGASLTAAMQTKTTSDRTTLTARAKSSKPAPSQLNSPAAEKKQTDRLVIDKPLPTADITRQTSSPESSRPHTLVSGKPQHESSTYKELVDKYCFYGSSRQDTKSKATDDSITTPSSSADSPSRSPSPQTHRSVSAGARSSSTSPSRVAHGYPYHQPLHAAPAAIRG